MRFSQRYGYVPVNDLIQIENVNEELRNGIWDGINIYYWNLRNRDLNNPDIDILIKSIWHQYFKKPIDTIPNYWEKIYQVIRQYFFKCEWFEVYDLIEFISATYNPEYSSRNSFDRRTINDDFRGFCNKILERENAAYRFVGGCITRITSEQEIDTIQSAISYEDRYKVVSTHLETSLILLTDRSKPDYRNSIKESICAVEALCKILSGDSKATLGKALKIIDERYEIHGSLKGAFEKLYGYTSDADGIRHALLAESNLKYEDALYMLITCSAFTNYLITKVSI